MVPGAVLRVAADAAARRHGVGRVPVPHYSPQAVKDWRADLHHGTEGAGWISVRYAVPASPGKAIDRTGKASKKNDS
jgi:hypothetical protein